VALLGRPGGSSSYFRLSTRPIDQSLARLPVDDGPGREERRRLVLVPRETPLSAIHLENMLRLTQAGAVILPAAPGFYNKPTQISELVDFIVARVLDQLGVEHVLSKRWE